jgi:amino-acid N-acetyltransferase
VKEANGIVRVEMEALLSMELANSPMWGADIRVSSGNFVTAKPVGVVNGVDFRTRAKCARSTPRASAGASTTTRWCCSRRIGFSPTGDVFNCTLEDVATAAAMALQADKLIFLTETAGVPRRARASSSPSSR